MNQLLLLTQGPFRWWIVPLAYVGHLAVLIGLSFAGLPAAVGQVSIFAGYALLAWVYTAIVARSNAGAALGMDVPARPLWIIGISLLAMGVTSLIEKIGAIFSPEIAQSTSTVLTAMGMGQNTGMDFLLILTICCAAPIGEEAIFRGLIFKGLYDTLLRIGGVFARGWLVFVIAAGFASLLFTQSHGGEGQEAAVLIALFLSGLIYALCYALTGSLWSAILAHSLNNTIALGVVLIGSDMVTPANQMAILAMPLLTWALMWLWARAMNARHS